jgi:DNA repair protein RecO (recombination protein O)
MKSRFGCALEPFVHSDLNLFEKPNDHLYRITQADIREPMTGLREDLPRMSAAGRLVNLVAALTGENDACPHVFDALSAGLRTLEAGEDVALTTLLFEIRLLGLSGFRPQLDPCAACAQPRGAATGRFSPVAGGLLCERCGGRDGQRVAAVAGKSRGAAPCLAVVPGGADPAEGGRPGPRGVGPRDRGLYHHGRRQAPPADRLPRRRRAAAGL